MVENDLKVAFHDLLSGYMLTDMLIEKLWKELVAAYSGEGRHYHSLQHLWHIHKNLLEVRSRVSDWEAVLFALFYHDVVYEINGKLNEEKSAALAARRLTEIGVAADTQEKVKGHILATKRHDESPDDDTNYFTDADLCILGQSWSDYRDYLSRLRKEYQHASDREFAEGRTREMKQILKMPRIFKTDHFYNRYELSARDNIRKELESYKE
jgi:predicted metal-dependent HD superfamily phosphohydrolase